MDTNPTHSMKRPKSNSHHTHFTGTKKSGTKRKNKSTRKLRKMKRGTGKNKYSQFSKVDNKK